MTTITANAAAALEAVADDRPARPSFFRRLGDAIVESRRRRAEIEVRRALAIMGEPRERLDYALLPFRGE